MKLTPKKIFAGTLSVLAIRPPLGSRIVALVYHTYDAIDQFSCDCMAKGSGLRIYDDPTYLGWGIP